MLLGKSDPKSDVFDVLLYASWNNHETLTIPSFVRIFESFALNRCNVRKLEFLEDSCLEIIESKALDMSLLYSIQFPSSVRIVEESAFNCNHLLGTVTFQNNSKLEVIETGAFSECTFKTITITPHVKTVCKFF
ncbi:hypothetical protein M9Y10_027052 [Tritrichomonas musculus]|uniref:Surface antigen BspA-like n=1 Tax=Tritrichomonas musculus TaxID=1915356 RepID=A0ABR2H5E9_9EUKA